MPAFLFTKTGLQILGVIGAILGLLWVYHDIKLSGRQEVQNENARAAIESSLERKQEERVINSLPPAAIDDKLRPYYRD